MPARPLRAFALLLGAAALPACAAEGLAFATDRRVEITAPQDRDLVRLPFELTWEVSDFEVTGADGRARDDAGWFAVFVDRTPQQPGQPLEGLAAGDETCRPQDGCPDDQWFLDHRIFPVEGTSLEIEQLPPGPQGRREVHELTVVLLDGTGARIGESAFRVSVELDRSVPAATGAPG